MPDYGLNVKPMVNNGCLLLTLNFHIAEN